MNRNICEDGDSNQGCADREAALNQLAHKSVKKIGATENSIEMVKILVWMMRSVIKITLSDNVSQNSISRPYEFGSPGSHVTIPTVAKHYKKLSNNSWGFQWICRRLVVGLRTPTSKPMLHCRPARNFTVRTCSCEWVGAILRVMTRALFQH